MTAARPKTPITDRGEADLIRVALARGLGLIHARHGPDGQQFTLRTVDGEPTPVSRATVIAMIEHGELVRALVPSISPRGWRPDPEPMPVVPWDAPPLDAWTLVAANHQPGPRTDRKLRVVMERDGEFITATGGNSLDVFRKLTAQAIAVAEDLDLDELDLEHEADEDDGFLDDGEDER